MGLDFLASMFWFEDESCFVFTLVPVFRVLEGRVWKAGLGEPLKPQIAIPTGLPTKGKRKTVMRIAAMTGQGLECNTCNCFAICRGGVIMHNYNPVALTANSRALCVCDTTYTGHRRVIIKCRT